MPSYQLTATADDILGSGTADRITGPMGSLQTFDTIDGGGGRDILVGNVDRNGTQAPTIRNVEEIFLMTGGLPFDLANVTGADQIFAYFGSTTLQSIGTDDLGTTFGASNVSSGTVKLQFEDGALSGSNDTLRLQADASNVTFTSNSFFDATNDGEANETADRLRIENINLSLTGGERNQVDISDFSDIQQLTLVGNAEAKIFVDASTLELVDARGTSGGVTLTNDISGDQEVLGGTGNDEFKTGSGNDVIRGEEGDDMITAGSGDNFITGGEGNDMITSEQGSDAIAGGGGDDVISSGSGDDQVTGGAGNDEITAGDGADAINGGDGNDDIRAQGGADTIFDGAGDDVARGGGDNDTFIAGAGTDEFIGGGGSDLFVFSDDFGRDTVSDFTLTTSASTNDRVEFIVGGMGRTLQSQDDFQMFADANSAAITVDKNTDTITIDSDTGTIVLEVSDADFLMV